MTEKTILILCFIFTFGFILHKMLKFIKKVLSKYVQNIENNISKSEALKLDAINLLEKAKERERYINNEIKNKIIETEKKILEIKDDYSQKLANISREIIENNKKKIEYEKAILIDDFSSQIKKTIVSVTEQYIHNEVKDDEKNNAMLNIISKIDFKKLAKVD